jgi:hypothetical protein
MTRSAGMTRSEFRRFLRHLSQCMREEKIHRGMRHAIERAIREFFYAR